MTNRCLHQQHFEKLKQCKGQWSSSLTWRIQKLLGPYPVVELVGLQVFSLHLKLDRCCYVFINLHTSDYSLWHSYYFQKLWKSHEFSNWKTWMHITFGGRCTQNEAYTSCLISERRHFTSWQPELYDKCESTILFSYSALQQLPAFMWLLIKCCCL